MLKMFTTNFTLRRNLVLHATGLQIALHIFLYNITAIKKCSSNSLKRVISFSFNHLLQEVVSKLFGVKDNATIGRLASGLMKVT
jgi:hypothetical protein